MIGRYFCWLWSSKHYRWAPSEEMEMGTTIRLTGTVTKWLAERIELKWNS